MFGWRDSFLVVVTCKLLWKILSVLSYCHMVIGFFALTQNTSLDLSPSKLRFYGKSSDLHSGSARLESHQGYRLFWLGLLWFSSVPSGKPGGSTSGGQRPFPSNPFPVLLFIRHHQITCLSVEIFQTRLCFFPSVVYVGCLLSRYFERPKAPDTWSERKIRGRFFLYLSSSANVTLLIKYKIFEIDVRTVLRRLGSQ
jgi:hypothetical protein